MTKSVSHISFSSAGGTGSVAKTLASAQRVSGRDAQVLSVIDSNLLRQPLKSPAHTVVAALDEYVVKKRDFGAPISLFRDHIGSRIGKDIPMDSLIHIHGFNGALGLNELARLGETHRIIWTLHDMNPFTGGCHYSLDCTQYKSQCTNCPAVKLPFQSAVEGHQEAKIATLKNLPDLRIVAPSQWLANEASQSAVLAGREIAIIPNPFGPEFLPNHKFSEVPSKPEAGLRFLIVAANLSDPVKNVAEAVAAFHRLRVISPRSQLNLVGGGGREFSGEHVTNHGLLESDQLGELFARCDVILIPSLAENSPLVIAEAASQGCRVIAREVGGMPEVVSALNSGATYKNISELDELLGAQRVFTPAQRTQLSDRAISLFSPKSVAAQYDEVYES